MANPNSHSIPEWQDVAKKHAVEALEAKVARCYSQDHYEDFEAAVEKIMLKALEMDSTQAKLSPWVRAEVKQELASRWWKNFSFWIPTVVAIAAVAVAILKD